MFHDLNVDIPRQGRAQALDTLQRLGYDVVAFTTTVSGERKLQPQHLPPSVDYSAWRQPKPVSLRVVRPPSVLRAAFPASMSDRLSSSQLQQHIYGLGACVRACMYGFHSHSAAAAVHIFFPMMRYASRRRALDSVASGEVETSPRTHRVGAGHTCHRRPRTGSSSSPPAHPALCPLCVPMPHGARAHGFFDMMSDHHMVRLCCATPLRTATFQPSSAAIHLWECRTEPV